MSFKRWFAAMTCAAALCAPVLALAIEAPNPAPRPSFRASTQTVVDPAAPTQLEPAADPATPAVAPETATGATEAIAAVVGPPQPVTLTARITEDGPPIAEGIVWRIFETKTDPTGQLALAAKSEDAVARVALPPGQYVVHVAYGRSQASDTLTVAEGQNEKSVILDAGALRLNSAIAGDIPIPINLLRFDVFAAPAGGEGETDRVQIAQDVAPNDVLTLNAGTYHVVSYFGAVNAVVRADLKVDPGQMTDAMIYHRAAQVSFKLVTQTGGEAVADVEWTVKTADGTTVFTEIGAFPSTVLEEGDYLVLAKQGEKVFNRAFQVQPGQPREIEVLTAVY